MTQSETHGIPGCVSSKYSLRLGVGCKDAHLAYSESIIPETISIRFSSDRLMKLVSTSTRYGGARDSLCDKKSEVGTGALRDCCKDIPISACGLD